MYMSVADKIWLSTTLDSFWTYLKIFQYFALLCVKDTRMCYQFGGIFQYVARSICWKHCLFSLEFMPKCLSSIRELTHCDLSTHTYTHTFKYTCMSGVCACILNKETIVKQKIMLLMRFSCIRLYGEKSHHSTKNYSLNWLQI